MDNDRGVEESWSDWDSGNRNFAVGTILASALIVGVVTYVFRRRREAEERMSAGTTNRATAALDRLGDDRAARRRELLTEKALPESKPALLALLRELETMVAQAFRRLERTIEEL